MRSCGVHTAGWPTGAGAAAAAAPANVVMTNITPASIDCLKLYIAPHRRDVGPSGSTCDGQSFAAGNDPACPLQQRAGRGFFHEITFSASRLIIAGFSGGQAVDRLQAMRVFLTVVDRGSLSSAATSL